MAEKSSVYILETADSNISRRTEINFVYIVEWEHSARLYEMTCNSVTRTGLKETDAAQCA